MNILIVNQYNSDNLGDKILNDAICKHIKSMNYKYTNIGFAQIDNQDIEYTIPTFKNSLTKRIKRFLPPICKYLLNYKRKLKKAQNEIKNQDFDLLLIGGGQLIKHKSVFMYCLKDWVKFARMKKIKVVLFGVSIDSNINQFEKHIYNNIFKQVDKINVREYNSQSILKSEFGIDSYYSPDIAFSLYNYIKPKEKKRKLIVMPYDYGTAKFNFQTLGDKESYYEELLRLIEMNKSSNNDLVLTATTGSDLNECYFFSKFLESKGIKNRIEIAKNSEELFNLLEDTDTIISGRMHAMIIGLIMKCNIIPINVSNKIENFCKTYLDDKEKQIKDISKESVIGLETILKVKGDRYEN